MPIENIVIANLSCGGCVNTITKTLMAISGVEKVDVELLTGTVSTHYLDGITREQLTQALWSIGYPEATEKNGLLTKLKSRASCLTGKITGNKINQEYYNKTCSTQSNKSWVLAQKSNLPS